MMASQLRNHTLVLAAVIVGIVTFGRARTESAPVGLPQLIAEVDALKAEVIVLRQQVSNLNGEVSNQANAISSLQTTVADHAARLQFVTVAGTEMFITGANVNIRDGSGFTSGTPASAQTNPTGLGNLIIGYNEPLSGADRTGSHNLVIGPGHGYTSVGGLVAGFQNSISGPYSSVTGGAGNQASGEWASVSGGINNVASYLYSSVSGGKSNTAMGSSSSVSGGLSNIASGDRSSVSGGVSNVASGDQSSVSGGASTVAGTNGSWGAGGLHQP
jgi:hypothetical protein